NDAVQGSGGSGGSGGALRSGGSGGALGSGRSGRAGGASARCGGEVIAVHVDDDVRRVGGEDADGSVGDAGDDHRGIADGSGLGVQGRGEGAGTGGVDGEIAERAAGDDGDGGGIGQHFRG